MGCLLGQACAKASMGKPASKAAQATRVIHVFMS
jgi:hypothetical protein